MQPNTGWLKKTLTAPAITSALALATLAGVAQAGQYEGWIKKVAANPGAKLNIVTATFLGGSSDECFVGGGTQPDGSIVLVGNALPDGAKIDPVPANVANTRWGEDRAVARQLPQPGKSGKIDIGNMFQPRDPASSGFIVRLSPDGQKTLNAARLGLGIGSFSAGIVGDDGAIYVVGRCDGAALRAAAGPAEIYGEASKPPEPAAAPADANPKKKSKAPPAPVGFSDAYIARISPDGKKFDWVHLLSNIPGKDDAILFGAERKELVVNLGGIRRITIDGKTLTDTGIAENIANGKTGLGVDEKTGDIIRGGDRNTHTGREPYRDPFLNIYDKSGKQRETLWNFPPKEVGGAPRLVSDSSPRNCIYSADGDIVIAGWSDGGNSVFGRNPKDMSKGHDGFKTGLGISSAGMGVGSMCWIMVIDPVTFDVKRGTQWDSFVPDDKEAFGKSVGKPNNASAHSIAMMADKSFAMTGTAATGLIETPDAIYKYPGKGRFGGWYFTVLSPELNKVRFSSYLPATDNLKVISIGPDGHRLLVIGTTAEKAGENIPAPSANPIQPKFGGGHADGFFMLLEDAK